MSVIADIIHKVAAMGNDEQQKYYPRPSLAGPDRCIRSLVYWGLGFPRQPFPGRTMVVFDDGVWHEELTKEWIRQSAFKVHSEQMRVNCLPPLTYGSIDFIITGIGGVDVHVEHKAINHFTFQRFESLSEYPLDYFTQTAIYNEAIQRELNPALRTSLLLVKNKNTGAYLEYILDYDRQIDKLYLIAVLTSERGQLKNGGEVFFDGIVIKALNKFDWVADCVKNKTLPKRPYEIDNWHCEYCQFGGECWKDYDKEFLELKTEAMLPEEVATAVKYYKELGAQKKEITAEYDTLKDKIKAIMKEAGAREGIAGEYVCRLKFRKGASEQLYISRRREQ